MTGHAGIISVERDGTLHAMHDPRGEGVGLGL
jgi:gamma-glutamyltranspeptidase/glutathione hydrolase